MSQAQFIANRRGRLGKTAPICPKCGETLQVQLVDWFKWPAQWKCWVCDHQWEQEPERMKEKGGI